MEDEKKEWVLSSMNQEELIEAIKGVVDGRESITFDELLALVPEIAKDECLVEVLLYDLSAMGVSVLPPNEVEQSKDNHRVPVIPDLDTIRPEDLLTLYLAELSREPLLSRDEEIQLARKIESGRRAKKACEETDYTAKEYRRLLAQIEAGKAARRRLGSANTRLVVSIAKRYRGYGIPFPDLIQNGNVGLMRAVDRYDPNTGNRFSTYATWWIRQAVTRSLSNHGRLIRIPVHTGGLIRKMGQVAQRLEMEQGEWPSSDDIATEMGESPDKIRLLMRWAQETTSLEKPVGDDGDAELQDFLEDENLPHAEEVTDVQILKETLGSLLYNLTVREVQILRLRYGLGGTQTHTLGQIGEKLGLSRERIRQIERESLAKLRLVGGKNRLEQFL